MKGKGAATDLSPGDGRVRGLEKGGRGVEASWQPGKMIWKIGAAPGKGGEAEATTSWRWVEGRASGDDSVGLW